MYFLRGMLPWQGLKAATNKQKYEKIGEKKRQIPISELCNGFPEEFAKYLSYARHLKFEEQPDYDYLIKLFNNVMKKHHLVNDQVYDWMLLDQNKDKVRKGTSEGSALGMRGRSRRCARPLFTWCLRRQGGAAAGSAGAAAAAADYGNARPAAAAGAVGAAGPDAARANGVRQGGAADADDAQPQGLGACWCLPRRK